MPSNQKLDSNGYAPSILQDDCTRCFVCGRRDRKLDRHEVWGQALRQKSKKYGLWIMLCHDPCHTGSDGIHNHPERSYGLKAYAQFHAMKKYGWSVDDFRKEFYKNYLEVDDDAAGTST